MAIGIYDGLKKIRRRRRALWLCAPGTVAVNILAAFATERLFPEDTGFLFVVFAVSGGVCLAVSALDGFSRCPRCGHLFYWFGVLPFGFARACLHCGLKRKPKWNPTDEQRQEIRRWLATSLPGDPIPDVALPCSGCAYPLTGLVDHRCPECGEAFDVKALVGIEG